MADTKDAFFQRSTAVVELCNSQLPTARDIEIAASAAHGAARFSVWSLARTTLTRRELEARKAQALDAFTNGYREMLEEHFADYSDNFDTYFEAKAGAVTRKTAPPK